MDQGALPLSSTAVVLYLASAADLGPRTKPIAYMSSLANQLARISCKPEHNELHAVTRRSCWRAAT
jgi:hypothetical protein